MSPEIIYIDRNFLVAVKPQGVPSQPDTTGRDDMMTLLSAELRVRGECDKLYLVHRLDSSTGGLMLFARNARAAAELSALISDKEHFKKEYLAIVSGAPCENEGALTDYIFKDSRQGKAFVVERARKGAKEASLSYKVQKSVSIEEKSLSLLRVELHTGRFHQIRVQLASRKMPIYGDGKYGSREKAEHFALWAHRLEFEYRGKSYRFESLPDMTKSPWNLFG